MGSVRKGRKIDSALRKKGFRRETSGDHVVYYFMDENGEDTDTKTKVSHGAMGDTIGANLISLMSRQLHLTKKQFFGIDRLHIGRRKLSRDFVNRLHR